MNDFFDKIGIDLGILVLMLMVLVLILIVIILNMSLGLHRLNRKYTMFMKGSDGQSLERVFAQKLKEVDRLSSSTDDNYMEIQRIKKKLGKTLTKYGIVKYDAFDDVGGKLSFALAMLDKNNTGFILNAIHSRDNCFFYIKEIVNGESYILLSSEEMDVLRQAVRFGEVEM
jgi:hypothetical protein